jgi:hypothetical protein
VHKKARLFFSKPPTVQWFRMTTQARTKSNTRNTCWRWRRACRCTPIACIWMHAFSNKNVFWIFDGDSTRFVWCDLIC